MRANSPVDDFSLFNLPEDEKPVDKLTPEVKELAKAAKTKDGQIILDHLKKRIEDYTQRLKSIDVTSVDHIVGLAKIMAAQGIIQEFESVINDTEISLKMVTEAAKETYARATEE